MEQRNGRLIIRTGVGEAYNAASKARRDAEAIAVRQGYEAFVFRGDRSAEGSVSGAFRLAGTAVRNWRALLRRAEPDSLVLLQYPHFPMKSAIFVSLFLAMHPRRPRLIALVHDLDSLRGLHGQASMISDRKLLPRFDAVICHNEAMKAYLLEQGIPERKLIPLGIFDYLTDAPARTHRKADGIAVAGNLSTDKSGYLVPLMTATKEAGLPLHLYGKGLETEGSPLPSHVCFHGTFPPETLPGELEGGFGLVWDGPAGESCSGPAGDYLRWNNPHKLSLYLAAGLPVIVWKEAATAPMIQRKGVGILLERLEDLGKTLGTVTDEAYAGMAQRVKELGGTLREGACLTQALAEAEERLRYRKKGS